MAKWESQKWEPSFRGGISGGSGVDSHYNNKIYVKYLATKRPWNILNQNMPHLSHHMHPQQI